MTQLTLPGFDAPPPVPVHRFFFAVMPDTATAARIAGIAKSLRQQKDSPVGTERLHITLGSLTCRALRLHGPARSRIAWKCRLSP